METQFIPTWAVAVLLLILCVVVMCWAVAASAELDLDADTEQEWDPDLLNNEEYDRAFNAWMDSVEWNETFREYGAHEAFWSDWTKGWRPVSDG